MRKPKDYKHIHNYMCTKVGKITGLRQMAPSGGREGLSICSVPCTNSSLGLSCLLHTRSWGQGLSHANYEHHFTDGKTEALGSGMCPKYPR